MKTLSLEKAKETTSVQSVRLLGAQASGNVLPLIFEGFYSEAGVSDYVWKNGAVWEAYSLADNDRWQNHTAPDSLIPPLFGWGLSLEQGLDPVSVQHVAHTYDISDHNDIHLDSAGNLALATDAEGLRQKLETRLKLYRGEWFLDVNSGVPYIQRILGRAQAQPQGNLVGSVSQIFDVEILKEPEVLSIIQSDALFDSQARTFTYSAELETIFGPITLEETTNG